MRYILFSTILTVAVLSGLYHTAFAACGGGPTVFTCDATPPNPDPNGIQQDTNNNGVRVDVLPNGNIDTGNFAAIHLGDGANEVQVNRATVEGNQRALELGTGPDIVIVNDAELIGSSFTINLSGGSDNLEVNDSNVIATDAGFTINLVDGNDTVVINRSIVRGGPNGSFIINGASGMDDITIIDSTVTTDANAVVATLSLGEDNDKALIVNSTISKPDNILPVRGGAGDDIITLGGFGSDIPGGIDCDSGPITEQGFDTLIFALEVPAVKIPELTEKIENLPTPNGSISINGFTYLYVRCDEIVADLRAPEGKPIPTLSEWGLIAMVGVLGIFGLLAVRKRAAA